MANNFDFYNPHRLLSYDATFNFIMDVRGKGKTYTFAKKDRIDNFLATGKEFIYLRRYKEECKNQEGFFTDIEHLYPDHVFVVKGRTMYCDEKIIGHIVPLSTAMTKKSVSYPNVDAIIYDEFILEKGYVRYLPNEVNAFLNFYETVARTRDRKTGDGVKVYFLGNAIEITNPYFLHFKIIPRKGKRFTSVQSYYSEEKKGKVHLIVAEIGQDDDKFREQKLDTDFGRIIQGTQFADMSVHNEFRDSHDTFVEKKHNKSVFRFSITYEGHEFGIWSSEVAGKVYVNKQVLESQGKNYALTTSDHKPNLILIQNQRNNTHLKLLRSAFSKGFLFFDSVNTRNIMYDVLQLL